MSKARQCLFAASQETFRSITRGLLKNSDLSDGMRNIMLAFEEKDVCKLAFLNVYMCVCQCLKGFCCKIACLCVCLCLSVCVCVWRDSAEKLLWVPERQIRRGSDDRITQKTTFLQNHLWIDGSHSNYCYISLHWGQKSSIRVKNMVIFSIPFSSPLSFSNTSLMKS